MTRYQNGDREEMDDTIAIVGMACRFPQEAENTEKLWELLINSRSASTDFPASKMNLDAHYHPDPAHGGTMSCKGGHFLKHNGSEFDAPFFSITKTEAVSMDPQQRILMENVYEALENAGIPMERAIGSETSVYVGAFTNDYETILNTDPEILCKYGPTGNSKSILSNRVSWFYDFKGCSLTVDTACSSSLVALHLACQNLKDEGAKMAIVSGVNIIESPGTLFRMSNIGFLSPDSKCYSFDHRANGYSRGEGVGTVILKPLRAALQDKDTIRAVIRGTGVNQDGRTPGMTVPSRSAQERLIRSVYKSAGLDLGTTGYVEAHGTGTAAGDPVEAGALGAAWSERQSKTPLYIGALKSNIGHLEGAAGIAGIIKTVQVLEKAVIPPNVNFEKVNPKIDVEGLNIEFPVRPIPWPKTEIRRASVNSFGFGGSNAHAVLDDARSFLNARSLSGIHRTVSSAPLLEEIITDSIDREPFETNVNGNSLTNGHVNGITHKPNGHSMPNGIHKTNGIMNGEGLNGTLTNISEAGQVFVFSSFDEAGIKRTAEAYAKHLSTDASLDGSKYLHDLAYTLVQKRSMFPWKGFAVASSLQGLLKALPDVVRTAKHARKSNVPKLGFVFTGQGAQWHAMGRELLVYPVFRKSLEAASNYLDRLNSPWHLIDELLKDRESSLIDHPDLSQAACTALQIALIDLLSTWNITPARVTGHSSGEICAAYCVGALTRESALRIAYYRGIVSAKLIHRNGGMMAVLIEEERLVPYLEKVKAEMSGELVMACFNSPKNITVSGDQELIDRLKVLLKEEDVFCRKLKVKNAYHSGHMVAVANEYLDLIGDISSNLSESGKARQKAFMFSTVTGLQVPLAELRKPEYWISNMISPVKFVQGLSKMCSEAIGRTKLGVDRVTELQLQDLLEIGPHPALNTAIRETLSLEPHLSTTGYSYLVSRNDSALDFSLRCAGKLFCSGYPVDLLAVNSSNQFDNDNQSLRPQMLVDLPPYEFNHSQTYWGEGRLSKNFRFRKFPRHDLLGGPVPDWNVQDPKWKHTIRVSENPWLKDHKVTGRIVYPGVGYLIMAIEAASQLAGPDAKVTGYRLRDISIKTALQVPDTEFGVETIFSMPHASESSLGSSSVWREFKLSSYNPNSNDWTEHCRGQIKVELELDASPIDAGREHFAQEEKLLDQLTSISTTCTVPVDMARSYSELETIGMTFGPLFRNLKNVMRGNGTGNAIGHVTLPDVRAAMPKKFTHPHVIHPATLDSMMHIFLPAIEDFTGARLTEPGVPVFMKEIWVAHDISKEKGRGFRSHGTAERISHNKLESNITVWDELSQKCKVMFKGVQLVPLQSSSVGSSKRQINYNVEWRPDIDLLDPSESEKYLRERATPSTIDETTTLQLAEDFNLAAMMYILDAMKIIKDETLDLPEHHRKYLTWLHFQKEQFEKGLIRHQKPEWNSIINDSKLTEEHLAKIGKAGPEGELTVRMGSNIVSVLRQEVDPLQLMFGDDLLDAYYREGHGTDRIHDRLHSYLELYGHKYVNLKVLEIGAGTGGTTVPVLETLCPPGRLSKIDNYTYTDLSVGFFEKAKDKFKNWKHILEFKKLDIEKDPMSQGFEPGSYDLIIAANVLHATADLNTTLTHVESLLKPNGKLLLHEGIRVGILGGPMAFGTLPGWWLSVEPFRQLGPLLTESEWDAVLLQSGFGGTDLVAKDYERAELHAQSLMVTTATRIPSNPKDLLKTVLIVSSSSTANPLIKAIRSTFQKKNPPEPALVHPKDLEERELKDTVCIVLLELEHSEFLESESDFKPLQHLLNTCAGGIWVTGDSTSNTQLSLVTGLMRTIRWERDLDDSNLVLLGIENASQSVETSARQILHVYEHQFVEQRSQRNAEYSSIGGIIHINRLVPADYLDDFLHSRVSKPTAQLQPYGADPTRALKLSIDTPGILNTLQFVDCPTFKTPLPPNEVEVEIKATGLNFRDIMSAMGEVGGDSLGAEGAGIVARVGSQVNSMKAGDRVTMLASTSHTGCFHTFARGVQDIVAKIPDNLTFEEAAGIPVTWCTAYYCLIDIARLQKGESVLIHAAAGGVGQAAIMLAQSIGAEIFATVSTDEKRRIIMDSYNIPESHILSSRDLSFAKGVMRLTNARGVDVILNSLAGEALRVSWECIAPFGRFIEIGKRDIYANGRLEMFSFSKSVTFASVDLETVLRLDPKTISRLLSKVMSLWEEGLVQKTTPFNVFDYSQIESSFRLLQSGKHIGKVVLTAAKDDVVPVVPKAQTPYSFPSDETYVLAGGLGGLGRSMARWMVSRGARHLVFLSRKPGSNRTTEELVKELTDKECEVKVIACDVSDKASLEKAVTECQKTMPPIKGCIQGAMQLKDSAFENMTWENLQAALAPKVKGSWNLHTTLPKDMQFYIMLSSICGIVGNRGQSNYAAGNVYQDALARYRSMHGLPANSLDLGSMLSVGFIAENQETVSPAAFAADNIREDEFHALLEYHIDPRTNTNTPLRSQVAIGLSTRALFQRKGIPEPSFMRDPLFTQLRAISEHAAAEGDEDSFVATREAMRAAKTLDEASSIITEALVKRISSIMTLPVEDIDSGKPIHFYGVDSLVAVEFRNWLAKNMEASMEVLDIMGNDSIAQLSVKIAQASKIIQLEAEKAAAAATE